MFQIGTLADWFKVGLLEGIRESERCGATGVQLYAWNELNPFEITREKIAEVRRVAEDCGQKITALCGELSEVMRGHGLEIREENPKKIEFLKRTLDLAKELGCDIVTTHIGVVPDDETDPRYAALHDACDEVGAYAKTLDAWVAIETGPEPISRLSRFVDGCASGRIAINYDPANLVMVTGENEVEGVYTAAKRIVHTHAKDGVMRAYLGPRKIYDIFAEGGIEALAAIPNYFAETPLGQGSVKWIPYLRALRDVGYDGYLTIEREVGQNAAADIRLAVGFLKDMIKTIENEKM